MGDGVLGATQNEECCGENGADREDAQTEGDGGLMKYATIECGEFALESAGVEMVAHESDRLVCSGGMGRSDAEWEKDFEHGKRWSGRGSGEEVGGRKSGMEAGERAAILEAQKILEWQLDEKLVGRHLVECDAGLVEDGHGDQTVAPRVRQQCAEG